MYVISREWCGLVHASPGIETRQPTDVVEVIVHFADVPARWALPDGEACWREIQRFHMQTRGWLDIGYHVGVDMDGDMFAGRDPLQIGAHCLGNNPRTLGLCFLTNGGITPTAGAAAVEWINFAGFVLHHKLLVAPHRQYVQTNCPDDTLSKWVDDVCAPTGPLAWQRSPQTWK